MKKLKLQKYPENEDLSLNNQITHKLFNKKVDTFKKY